MAAFCNCCGAEIKLKAEACAVCGMPRHGMSPSSAKTAEKQGPKPAKRSVVLPGVSCLLGC